MRQAIVEALQEDAARRAARSFREAREARDAREAAARRDKEA